MFTQKQTVLTIKISIELIIREIWAAYFRFLAYNKFGSGIICKFCSQYQAKVKVHYCRFENLPSYSDSFRNRTLKINFTLLILINL